MPHGLEIRNQFGQVWWNDSTETYMFLDSFTVNSGTSGSRNYPGYVGRTVVVTEFSQQSFGSTYADIVNFTSINTSVTYPGGIPTISWSPVAGTFTANIIIFAVVF